MLLTGYLELLIKQNFSQTPDLEGDQFTAKRPHISDRPLSVKVSGAQYPVFRLCVHVPYTITGKFGKENVWQIYSFQVQVFGEKSLANG